jgi:hypothetical protein
MSTCSDDVDVARLLATPAELNHKLIWVSDICVRRFRERCKRPAPRDHVQLIIRQRLESGRYRRSAPAWLPAALHRWDGYVELSDGVLVGLVCCRDGPPRTFRAVTWFTRACLDWNVGVEVSRRPDVEVELTDHCVQRYRGRVRPDLELDLARAELGDILALGRIYPECPDWLVGSDGCRQGVPPYYLAIGEWMALPLRHSTRPSDRCFVAASVLMREPRQHEKALRDNAELLSFRSRLWLQELWAA